MQKAFINKIYELAEKNKNIVYLSADNGTDFDNLFARSFPNQFFNFGIAEQNMLAAASGMAMLGKIPFVCSSGAFLAYRGFEFIRNDIAFQNQKVIIIALGSGLSISALGPTHHTTEDIGILKCIPNLNILSIGRACEVSFAIDWALKQDGPTYIRLGMNDNSSLELKDYVSINDLNCYRKGKDGTIVVTGCLLEKAIGVANKLYETEKLDFDVFELIKIKPLNSEELLNNFIGKKMIITLEEHNVIGGIGDSVISLLNGHKTNKKVVKIGLNDSFAKGYGKQSEIQDYNGLSIDNIIKIIKNESKDE